MSYHYQVSQSRKEGGVRNPDMENFRLLEALRMDGYYDLTSEDEWASEVNNKNGDKAPVVSGKPTRKLKRRSRRSSPKDSEDEDEDDINIIDSSWLSKKQRRRQLQKASGVEKKESAKERRQRRYMERQVRDEERVYDGSEIVDTDLYTWGHFCTSCSAEFTTKNRLSVHAKQTGHSVYMPDKCKKKTDDERRPETKGNFYRRS